MVGGEWRYGASAHPEHQCPAQSYNTRNQLERLCPCQEKETPSHAAEKRKGLEEKSSRPFLKVGNQQKAYQAPGAGSRFRSGVALLA